MRHPPGGHLAERRKQGAGRIGRAVCVCVCADRGESESGGMEEGVDIEGGAKGRSSESVVTGRAQAEEQ